MWLKIYFIKLFLVFSFSLCSFESHTATTATLKALHILFRHGHRTSDNLAELAYPKDPYKDEKYYPYGTGQLTNQGKQRAYALGQWLRQRYNSFLGNTYNPNVLDAVSSGFNRTAITLSLVLAGLYPPKGTDLEWDKNLNWQPVLFNQLSSTDNYLSFRLFNCPKYAELFYNYLHNSKVKQKLQFYQPVIDYLQKHSGTKIPQILTAFSLYDILATQQEWGLKLPAWTEPVYPNIMHAVVLDYLDMLVGTTELKRFAAGALLEKIITDTALKTSNRTIPPERKLFIYSAHDFNVVFLQNLLGVYTHHRPTYSACIMIEVHKIKNVYGIKIYYDTKSRGEPKPLRIPGCNYFCPFKKFYKLVKNNLPTKDTNCNKAISSNATELVSFLSQL